MIFLFAAAFLQISGFNAYSQKSQSSNSDYQPPVFTDANRLKKMEAAFPAIEAMYKQHAGKNHIPGFVFGIVADGKLIHSGSFGYSDTSKKIPATSKSVFRIASMTKSFTTLAILKLRDDGKLRLDDPAYTYIPEMKKIQYLTQDSPPITVRHLMTHSAGFPEDNPWGDRQLADSDEDLINLINTGIALSNVPGVTFEYSNLGFALLGYIIKKVSGQPYQQYINSAILKPLGMTHTYWEYSEVPDAQLAHGHRWVNNKWQEEALLQDGSWGAMGGLMTSIEDFSQYMALHMSGWPPKNEQNNGPVKSSSIREMQQPWMMSGLYPDFTYPNGKVCPRVTGYGYGLGWAKDCTGKVTVGHSGGLPGFGSHWIILPEYGIGIVSFANLTYAAASGLNLQAMDTLINLAKLQPRRLSVSPILNQRKEQLAKLLPEWKGAAESGIFAENFFKDYSLEQLKKQATSLFSKAGKIIKVRELQAENQLRGSFIMEGEKADLEVYFTLTPENQPLIQEYNISEIPKR